MQGVPFLARRIGSGWIEGATLGGSRALGRNHQNHAKFTRCQTARSVAYRGCEARKFVSTFHFGIGGGAGRRIASVPSGCRTQRSKSVPKASDGASDRKGEN